MKIDGHCHCGRVTFEATIDPAKVGICHCTDCQSLTGSPYRVTVRVRAKDLTLTGAEPNLYTKLGDNGRKRLQYFCGECGSPLFTTGEGDEAAMWGIRWGSIAQRAALRPRSQIWCRSAVPWAAAIENLPGLETE